MDNSTTCVGQARVFPMQSHCNISHEALLCTVDAIMSTTHIPAEISVGPESAAGRSIRVSVSELWANWIEAAKRPASNRSLFGRPNGALRFVNFVTNAFCFALYLLGPIFSVYAALRDSGIWDRSLGFF